MLVSDDGWSYSKCSLEVIHKPVEEVGWVSINGLIEHTDQLEELLGEDALIEALWLVLKWDVLGDDSEEVVEGELEGLTGLGVALGEPLFFEISEGWEISDGINLLLESLAHWGVDELLSVFDEFGVLSLELLPGLVVDVESITLMFGVHVLLEIHPGVEHDFVLGFGLLHQELGLDVDDGVWAGVLMHPVSEVVSLVGLHESLEVSMGLLHDGLIPLVGLDGDLELLHGGLDLGLVTLGDVDGEEVGGDIVVEFVHLECLHVLLVEELSGGDGGSEEESNGSLVHRFLKEKYL